MTTQEKIFDPKLDPEIVRAADKYVEAQNALSGAKDKAEVAEMKLLELLKNTGKKSIQHGGMTIEITYTEAKEKIKMKLTKTIKAENGRG